MDGEKRKIHLSIGGKKFPVWVSKSEEKEEEQFRIATKLINKKMEQYQKKFSYQDNFDILAMTSLQVMKELVNNKQEGVDSEEFDGLLEISDKLDEIIQG